MVEDSVGYVNLELLLNAEMQRQSVVASKVFQMSRTQTWNRVKQIRGDGAYQRSQVFNELIESVGARPRYAVRSDPNKQALVEVSQKHIWNGARKLMKRAQLPYVYLGYALLHVGLLHNLSPPPGGKEPRLCTMFPYEKGVDWLSLLHTFGCLCHAVLDKKYHGLRKEGDRSLPAAWMGLDLDTSAHVVLVQGEIKRWRDVVNFDENQPTWPMLVKVWKAAGLKVDEIHGPPIQDDLEGLFVRAEESSDSGPEVVVTVKEEKEEGKLRQPDPEETKEEPREVHRGLSVEKLDHIDLRYAYVNAMILAGKAVLEKIGSNDNFGDANTKRQRGPKYTKIVGRIAQQ
eukprot:g52025.t1